MSKVLVRLLPLLLLLVFYPGGVRAQQPDRPPSLNMGDAVVTGFSGTIAPDQAQPRPANKSAIDLTFINPDGPSARIVDVSKPGYVWDGRLFQAPKTFDVFAKDVGQVFGVALDDQTPPNIYVAATSVFGLNIVSRGRDGLPERRKKGGPGAGWMKGQFGLDLQGGPGAIYKVDGRTGAVSLFANVTLDGVPNPGPGLGNLAYDSAHKQLLASDLYTGMIHRFDLDGKELSRYDHGVTGLGAAKLATMAFNPKDRPNIANARFESDKPATWGFAPAARRTWGLAVHDGRLYYAVVAGPQIWSVGIERDGNFSADPRWELDVPAQAGPLPVSDIAFAQSGVMILAQRALIAGSYDYSAFTQPGEPQVLRFWLKTPNDPPSPSRWKLIPEEFPVGFAGNYRNSNGGVALGYGYGADGTLSAGSCEAALWTTGQNLRNNPALRSQLEPSGPLVVHGLQGSPADLLRKANEPPTTSYFVDYDDKFDDPRASGHMGSVRILTQPCAGAIASRPVAPVNATLIGTSPRPQACTPTCICPPGTVLKGKECVKTDACPPPMIPGPVLGQCICPPGTVLVGKECVPRTRSDLTCPPPFIPGPTPGSCVCPPGTVQQGHTCVPLPHECQPPLVLDPVTHTCVCPPGTVQQGRLCVPQICPPPMVPGPCECPEGTVQDGGLCVTSIDLRVDKENTPGAGGGTWFNVWVTNVGPPITFPAGAITIDEVVPTGMTVSSVTGTGWTCLPPSMVGLGTMHCTYNLAGSLGTGVSLSSTMVVHYTTTGPGPFINCAIVGVGSSVGVDTNPSNDKACVEVTGTPAKPVDVGIEKIGKTTPWCPAPYYVFYITVTNGSNPWPGTGNIVVTDTVPNNMSFGPIASPPWTCPAGILAPGTTFTCTYNGPALTANQVLPLITIPATPKSGPPFPPYVNCASVAISSGSGFVDTIPTNNNVCTLPVTKPAVCCQRPAFMNAEGICTCPPPQVLDIVAGVCTCPDGKALIDGQCVTPPPKYCPPPKVLNAAGVCACPPPMVTGATPNTCVCPQGTTLVNGKCVPVDSCQPPMVQGPVAGECICPQGTVQKGRECLRPIECRPPLVPNANGTECVCRDGLVLRRGKCVEQEKPKPSKTCKRGFVWNGDMCVKRKTEPTIDIPRNLPGISFPGSRGRDTPAGPRGGSQGGTPGTR